MSISNIILQNFRMNYYEIIYYIITKKIGDNWTFEDMNSRIITNIINQKIIILLDNIPIAKLWSERNQDFKSELKCQLI